MSNDVFNEGAGTNLPDQNNSSLVETLVGEGKKFKTVEDLARGKTEADAFIERLKQEKADMLEEMKKQSLGSEQLEELRNELKALRTANVQPSRDGTNPALTSDGVKSLIEEVMTQTERNRSAQQNVSAANEAMVKTFGSLEKAAEAVKAKAAEVGMTMDALRGIAANSPTAFLKIMGESTVADVQPLNPNRVSPSALNTQQPQKAVPSTKEDFDAILKAQGRRVYFSPAVQTAIWKAIKAGTYQLD